MQAKSLLIVEPYELLPVDSGGKQRAFNTIKQLSKRYAVQIRIAGGKKKHFFSFLTKGVPYWFSDWSHTDNNIISTTSAEIVLIEYSQLLHLVSYVPKQVVSMYTAYDVSTVSFWRRLERESNPFKIPLHFFRWVEIYLYEKRYLPMYDTVIAVSEVDAQSIRKLFKVSNIIVLENGIDAIKFLPRRISDGWLNIGFIGSESHPPNKEAVDHLIDQISPALNISGQTHRIILAGDIKRFGNNILNIGKVHELQKFYSQIDVLVAPIYAGSGSRIKVLESLSFGRPVITTEIGAEGISVTSDHLIIVPKNHEKEPNAWVRHLQSLLHDYPHDSDSLKSQLSRLTWKNIFKKFKT